MKRSGGRKKYIGTLKYRQTELKTVLFFNQSDAAF